MASPEHNTGATPSTVRRLQERLKEREVAGLRRRLRARNMCHDGTIDLASNDYLGLARDPRLVGAATRAARDWGTGSTGSRLVTGSTELHAELEDKLAEFEGAPGALVFSSGYLANLAAVTTLSGAGSLIVSDVSNHASIVDACRLSAGRVVVTPHKDVAAVEHALSERGEEDAIVVTDAVFSVNGDLAPLTALHQACRRNGALLIVDEAHAFGVLGAGGRGAAAAAGLAGAPDVVRTLTLSKSLGSQGGAVLGSGEVVDTLIDTGRSFIFDTALAPACAGAALEALEVLISEPTLPERVRLRAGELAALASAHGFPAAAPEAAVLPVVLGAAEVAVDAAEICAGQGVRMGCFRPPSVPAGRSCLRLTARATLTSEEVTVVDKALGRVAALTRAKGTRE